MVDSIPQGGPPSGAAVSTFRVATPAAPIPGPSHASSPAPSLGAVPAAPKSRMGGVLPPASINGAPAAPTGIPFSARKAVSLDLDTVERRGSDAPNDHPPKPNRLFGLQEGPTYRPTEEEFKDPFQYIASIREEASKYGIAKIIPPDSWTPPFAIDTERFHFKTRRQELNSIEGGTRANLNYLDQLSKFHKIHGHNLTRFPSVDKRPLDLYKLKKAVETRGGFERVCKGKKWAEIGRDLGYSGKIMSSLSTSLKNSYQKWLHPYEEYIRLVKPGVHQLLEAENGGPFTPSPAPSPLKKSAQGTPTVGPTDSPALRASVALNASLQSDVAATPPTEGLRPPPSMSGFTAANSGGFTPVNTQPQPSPQPLPVSTSFSAVNASNGFHPNVLDSTTSTPLRNGDTPMLSAENTPDFRPSASLSNGQCPNPMKRTLSPETESGMNSEAETANGRRSKRAKKDGAPTVAGSHMTRPRMSTPQPFNPRVKSPDERPGDRCETCGTDKDPSHILLCDSCDAGYHGYCLEPPIMGIPEYDWHCPKCLVGTGEFGFEEGGIYSLRQFQERARNFKEGHFATKMPVDPISGERKAVTEDDVEREFWRLVESITETVEVEYGADVHSTTHGSGFPTIERNPRDPYCTDPWNLNILPHHPESLFRHIKSDISGMTVPWLYVGMVFSTFCWHNEDHYTYSANYQHFGATKTWYGIPAEDAEKFEQAMRDAVPELFETQPDLLFQLVTLLTPDQLQKAGVRVCALDQRAGEFVITFPEAYHAGFNHGFNFNEAVNFAPPDWEPYGELGVQRLQDYRRTPCFSHDELLLAAASRKDTTIKTAKWLAPALERMRDRELQWRADFLEKHKAVQEHTCTIDNSGEGEYKCNILIIDEKNVHEDELMCSYCKVYSHLSRFVCNKTNKPVCLCHAGWFECCSMSNQVMLPEHKRYLGYEGEHTLVYRMTNAELESLVQKVVDKAGTPEAWEAKLDTLLGDGPKPQLKTLKALLAEGEKIDWELNGLTDLRAFVEKCSEVAEEALNYTTRKQQKRKTDRVWRGRGAAGKAAAAAAEQDEKEKEYRKIENYLKLIRAADDLGFDSPEITALRERYDNITDFQKRAQAVLREKESSTPASIARLDELLEEGRGFNVDIPELEGINRVADRLKWLKTAEDLRTRSCTLQDVTNLIQQGLDLGISETHPDIHHFEEKKAQGELWEAKAKELMSVENVHYQQLDALSKQAITLPVTPETLAAVDAILKKQRDAQDRIVSLYQRSKNPDLRQRPWYREVRQAMEELNALNSKPAGTIDLEKEQKRHEDWMRRGKKLFGKANAPLHILHNHMKSVDERNKGCFDINDQPRMPVEPSSRHQSPVDGETIDGCDLFCICRKPESGMMIECEQCHEWYHSKCFKLARGKVKDTDKYTCPICDYRVKIPRDATRPRLDDLLAWQDEIPNLPFQPEEEPILESIISDAENFRAYVKRHMPDERYTSGDDITTQRFYLRKLEGAHILLAEETNYFRRELHRWAPVAPTPPQDVEVSLSTRKPRPTKQQKLMKVMGVEDPKDLPSHLRGKGSVRGRGSVDSGRPASLQPASEQSHTPPGEPPGMHRGFSNPNPSSEQDYFAGLPMTSGFNNSPTFATNAPLNFGGTSEVQPIDPGLFEGGAGHAVTSPQLQDVFKSSGSGGDMFADMNIGMMPMEPGGGQAEEALAVTEREFERVGDYLD